MASGHLDLPIYEFKLRPDLLGSYFAYLSDFRTEALRLPSARERLAKLEVDPRVAELSKKLVSSGQYGVGFNLDSLISWWTWRANIVGEQQADSEIEDFLANDEIDFSLETWVSGIRLENTIEIDRNLRLVPTIEMQDSTEKERALSSMEYKIPGAGYRSSSSGAALVSHFKASKVFDPEGPGPSLNLTDRHTAIALLLNTLPDTRCISVYQTSRSQEHCPFGSFGGSAGTFSTHDVAIQLPSFSAQIDAQKLRYLESRFFASSQKIQTLILRALERFALAKGRSENSDRALDLGIALEMVLLSDMRNEGSFPGQWHVQFRSRGAWLIGNSYLDRKRFYKTLGEIYSARSQVAHTGTVASELTEKFTEHVALAEMVFSKFITANQPIDWPKLILGGMQE